MPSFWECCSKKRIAGIYIDLAMYQWDHYKDILPIPKLDSDPAVKIDAIDYGEMAEIEAEKELMSNSDIKERMK